MTLPLLNSGLEDEQFHFFCHSGLSGIFPEGFPTRLARLRRLLLVRGMTPDNKYLNTGRMAVFAEEFFVNLYNPVYIFGDKEKT